MCVILQTIDVPSFNDIDKEKMELHASNFHEIVSVSDLFAFDDFSFLSAFTKYRIKEAILKLHT